MVILALKWQTKIRNWMKWSREEGNPMKEAERTSIMLSQNCNHSKVLIFWLWSLGWQDTPVTKSGSNPLSPLKSPRTPTTFPQYASTLKPGKCNPLFATQIRNWQSLGQIPPFKELNSKDISLFCCHFSIATKHTAWGHRLFNLITIDLCKKKKNPVMGKYLS